MACGAEEGEEEDHEDDAVEDCRDDAQEAAEGVADGGVHRDEEERSQHWVEECGRRRRDCGDCDAGGVGTEDEELHEVPGGGEEGGGLHVVHLRGGRTERNVTGGLAVVGPPGISSRQSVTSITSITSATSVASVTP